MRFGQVTLERQILFWGFGLVGLLLIVYLLGSTITPFAAGIVLGYLLDPVVLKLQSFGSSRLGASLLILTVFVLTVVLFFILVVPVLGSQFIAFAQHLPGYAVRLQTIAVDEGNAFIAKYGGHWLDALGLRQQLSGAQIQKSVGDFVAQSAQWLLDAFTRLVSGGAALFNFLSLLIVTPVVAFYILVDWDRMIAKLDSWLPLDHREISAKHRPGNKPRIGGFHSRPVDRLPVPWDLVQRRLDFDWARLRLSDRRGRRPFEFCALCRFAYRADPFAQRRPVSGMAKPQAVLVSPRRCWNGTVP